MSTRPQPISACIPCRLALLRTPLAALLLLAAIGAQAAPTKAELAQAQARYKADRAACLRGDTFQERDACLAEAAAVLREARAGRALVLPAQAYEENRVRRCQALPVDDREDCARRMRGEGTASGSVERGGIYRELTRTLPAPQK